MAKIQLLTLSSIAQLVNYQGMYMLGYGTLLGATIWVSFIGGVIAFKTLPRHQFGNLQHRTFPIYFSMSLALSAGLSAVWMYTHPDVLTHIARPQVADVAQLYSLASVALGNVVNLLVVGPMTSRTMFQRHKLEKEEGKTYNEPGVSDKMKALNKTFGMLHGVSSLLNLGAVFALLFHGLWIGNAGVKGY